MKWPRNHYLSFLLWIFNLFFFSLTFPKEIQIYINPQKTIRTLSYNPVGINVNYLTDDDGLLNPKISLVQSLEEMQIGSVRFPGGEKSDNYLWSVPPFLQPNPHFAIADPQAWPNREKRFSEDGLRLRDSTLDFDELMTICQKLQIEPFIVIAGDAHLYQDGPIRPSRDQMVETAVAWLHYANKIKNYRIKYWMIGNESWSSCAEGKKATTPEQYAQDYVVFASAMKKVDPNIWVIANTQEGKWIRTLLHLVPEDSLIDAVAISNYPIHNWKGGYTYYLGQTPNLVWKIQDLIQAIGTRPIQIIVSEYNAIDWSKAWPHQNDLGHALVNFQLMMDQIIIPQVHRIYFWNTRWVNVETEPHLVYHAIDKNGYLTPAGIILSLWGNFRQEWFIFSHSSHPKIRIWAMTSSDQQSLTLFLLNKDLNPHLLTIHSEESHPIFPLSTHIESILFSGKSPEDLHPTFTKSRLIPLSLTPTQIKLEIPPLAIYILRWNLSTQPSRERRP